MKQTVCHNCSSKTQTHEHEKTTLSEWFKEFYSVVFYGFDNINPNKDPLILRCAVCRNVYSLSNLQLAVMLLGLFIARLIAYWAIAITFYLRPIVLALLMPVAIYIPLHVLPWRKISQSEVFYARKKCQMAIGIGHIIVAVLGIITALILSY